MNEISYVDKTNGDKDDNQLDDIKASEKNNASIKNEIMTNINETEINNDNDKRKYIFK